MLCDICKAREAKVHLQQVDQKMQATHKVDACVDCAMTLKSSDGDFSMADLLVELGVVPGERSWAAKQQAANEALERTLESFRRSQQ